MLKLHSGFSLIELLVTVALVGILAMLAMPWYGSHVQKVRRSDGKVALMEAAQCMERFSTMNTTYTGATIGPGAGDTIRHQSPQGYYRLAFKAGEPTLRTYVLQAIPQGAHAADPCGTLTLDQAGGTSPPNCW